MQLFKTIVVTSLCLLIACAEDEAADSRPSESDASAEILAAYHGLDGLPARAALICPNVVGGEDGMPVVFSVQLLPESVQESAFLVENAAGEPITPACATLAPAIEPLELRTVLLVGDFGTADMPPKTVRVVGPLLDANGQSLLGVETQAITPLGDGPTLVLAESFDPNTQGLAGECPETSTEVVQITWAGGVAGAGGMALGEPQRLGITVTLADGRMVNPIALADDDPDNHVHLCLDSDVPAARVHIAAGLFEDPGHDPNPETQIDVQPQTPKTSP